MSVTRDPITGDAKMQFNLFFDNVTNAVPNIPVRIRYKRGDNIKGQSKPTMTNGHGDATFHWSESFNCTLQKKSSKAYKPKQLQIWLENTKSSAVLVEAKIDLSDRVNREMHPLTTMKLLGADQMTTLFMSLNGASETAKQQSASQDTSSPKGATAETTSRSQAAESRPKPVDLDSDGDTSEGSFGSASEEDTNGASRFADEALSSPNGDSRQSTYAWRQRSQGRVSASAAPRSSNRPSARGSRFRPPSDDEEASTETESEQEEEEQPPPRRQTSRSTTSGRPSDRGVRFSEPLEVRERSQQQEPELHHHRAVVDEAAPPPRAPPSTNASMLVEEPTVTMGDERDDSYSSRSREQSKPSSEPQTLTNESMAAAPHKADDAPTARQSHATEDESPSEEEGEEEQEEIEMALETVEDEDRSSTSRHSPEPSNPRRTSTATSSGSAQLVPPSSATASATRRTFSSVGSDHGLADFLRDVKSALPKGSKSQSGIDVPLASVMLCEEIDRSAEVVMDNAEELISLIVGLARFFQEDVVTHSRHCGAWLHVLTHTANYLLHTYFSAETENALDQLKAKWRSDSMLGKQPSATTETSLEQTAAVFHATVQSLQKNEGASLSALLQAAVEQSQGTKDAQRSVLAYLLIELSRACRALVVQICSRFGNDGPISQSLVYQGIAARSPMQASLRFELDQLYDQLVGGPVSNGLTKIVTTEIIRMQLGHVTTMVLDELINQLQKGDGCRTTSGALLLKEGISDLEAAATKAQVRLEAKAAFLPLRQICDLLILPKHLFSDATARNDIIGMVPPYLQYTVLKAFTPSTGEDAVPSELLNEIKVACTPEDPKAAKKKKSKRASSSEPPRPPLLARRATEFCVLDLLTTTSPFGVCKDVTDDQRIQTVCTLFWDSTKFTEVFRDEKEGGEGEPLPAVMESDPVLVAERKKTMKQVAKGMCC